MQLNKALIGFLTHTGYAHGGNGYEGIAYLIEQFKDSGLTDPSSADHGIDLQGAGGEGRRAVRAVQDAEEDRSAASTSPSCPGVNHPVFKDKPVNHDPREVFIAQLFEERGETNVFHAVLPRAGAGSCSMPAFRAMSTA